MNAHARNAIPSEPEGSYGGNERKVAMIQELLVELFQGVREDLRERAEEYTVHATKWTRRMSKEATPYAIVFVCALAAMALLWVVYEWVVVPAISQVRLLAAEFRARRQVSLYSACHDLIWPPQVITAENQVEFYELKLEPFFNEDGVSYRMGYVFSDPPEGFENARLYCSQEIRLPETPTTGRGGPKTPVTGTESIRAEAYIPGSSIFESPSAPPGVCVAYDVNRQPIGNMFRFGDDLVTCSHVSANAVSCGREGKFFALPTNKDHLRRVDMTLYDMPKAAFAALGLKNLAPSNWQSTSRTARVHQHVRVKGYDCHTQKWVESSGEITGFTQDRLFTHSASTRRGLSGSPIFCNGKLVGIHVGSQQSGNGITSFNLLVSVSAIVLHHRKKLVRQDQNQPAGIIGESVDQTPDPYYDDELDELRSDIAVRKFVKQYDYDFSDLDDIYAQRDTTRHAALTSAVGEFSRESGMSLQEAYDAFEDYYSTEPYDHGGYEMEREHMLETSELCQAREEPASPEPAVVEDFRDGSQDDTTTTCEPTQKALVEPTKNSDLTSDAALTELIRPIVDKAVSALLAKEAVHPPQKTSQPPPLSKSAKRRQRKRSQKDSTKK